MRWRGIEAPAEWREETVLLLDVPSIAAHNPHPGEVVMKHRVTVLLLLALTVLTRVQAQGTDNTELLIGREQNWVGALANADTVTLDSILSDTYVDTDEHGQRTDKQGVLSALKSGDLQFESIKLSNMKVRDYGDAAVVTGSAEQTGNYKGQSLPTKIVFTDTFIKENGKWKAVASHRSAVPQRPPIWW